MATAKCKKVVREDGTGIDFTFINGHVLQVNLNDIPEEIRESLILHGLSQKIGDSYAGADTVEDCITSASDVYEQLKAGQWKSVRESTGGAPKSNQLVEAIMAITGRTSEEVNKMLDSKSDEERKAIRKDPRVAAQLAIISAQRAQERANKAQADAQNAPSLF